MRTGTTPVVVIGAGIAGLSTALAAAPREVVLIDPGGLNSSGLAQGGIAAALGPGDNVGAHVADTLIAGAFHNDSAISRSVLSQAPDAIAWLETIGVSFDRSGDGALQLGREGGHGLHRIVHAGGDGTGGRVVAALRERVRSAQHIHWCTGVDADALLMRGDAVAGVRMRDADGTEEWIASDAVVLATGGVGALFARTTNVESNTGSGLALAMFAGARLRDLEFVQFHPTALDCDRSRLPLVTEALRGAGARLIDDRGGALMAGHHPLGDLAPRDIVARRVWEASRSGRVLLDATALPSDWERSFPTVLSLCGELRMDPRRDPLPITAAAHFHMGGIATDLLGRSAVPNLHAVGEVACNGLHGANRLASNSLLEGVVCGRHLGAHLRDRSPRKGRGESRVVERGAALAPGALTQLRRAMWNAAGPVRTADRLREAIDLCERMPGWEARVARALLVAALRRTRSLGAHWRADAA
ncbi:FAD-dependent oxidoreductase [Lysobacter sp. LF1]|uniref:L-aspartate oxidase n=1 Tax=Lysobacter stagni TaxID=3045172 RepID=A0ABT6XIG2_9GAMM|nr:FAD-binding protein [Lysobacter sp. LF1]MDI9239947.1 FAD-dependent oxidoreductase [Lysobacter sp. LF1]